MRSSTAYADRGRRVRTSEVSHSIVLRADLDECNLFPRIWIYKSGLGSAYSAVLGDDSVHDAKRCTGYDQEDDCRPAQSRGTGLPAAVHPKMRIQSP